MREDRIEYLIGLVEKSDIAELEIWEGWGKRIRITKRAVPAPAPPPAAHVLPGPTMPAAATTMPVAPAGDDEDPTLVKVVSPMVGSFYRSPSQGAPPFVEVGSQVTPGQTLCIIEAMKIMNEITSEVSGSIRRVLVENEQPVEFGQVLFLIQKS